MLGAKRTFTKRTTGHVITGNAGDGEGLLSHHVGHAYTRAITLVNPIDEKVGKDGVCTDGPYKSKGE